VFTVMCAVFVSRRPSLESLAVLYGCLIEGQTFQIFLPTTKTLAYGSVRFSSLCGLIREEKTTRDSWA
jgi:hypothetical protein